MTIAVALILLGIPIATVIAEKWDGSKRDIRRMADHDRARQRVAIPQRRMLYAIMEKPTLLAQRGRPVKG